MGIIKSVAWLHTEQNRVLCVRTKGKDKFYIPGGKIDPQESANSALVREIQEELDVTLDTGSIQHVVTITAPAHGFNSDTQVEMQCFFARHMGELNANSEIDEIKWVGADYQTLCAPAAQLAIEYLIQQQKLTF